MNNKTKQNQKIQKEIIEQLNLATTKTALTNYK